MKKYDVIGVGCCAFDCLMKVSKNPGPDERIRAGDFIIQGGGEVGTALVAVARLGGKAKFIGRLGNDNFGEFLIEDFKREGVDTSSTILEKRKTTRFACILVDEKTGKRGIIYSEKGVPGAMPSDIRESEIKQAKYLLVSQASPGIEASLKAARIMKKAGGTVVLDATKIIPQTKEFLRLSDVIIVDEEFACLLIGEKNYFRSAQKIFSMKKKGIVVVTAGTKGSFCVSKEGKFHTQAFKVKAVDTTGAGDVFHGAFALGLLRKWPLPYTAKFASAVSAMKCRSLGGRAGIPKLAEVKKFLKISH
ncbi:hypothetical protein COY52_11515 [Candidatus Desantisbacteria bacterium CG_4_10_14_0_8_um_filter_48_22]|uniref:Carbohydrate kinase PfkB domain-containing protein n=1 Tax=Candidatus Desantisbacteria bacterium CG_4_10_14_0_8_um_filter_48_22 TaxID=1974543 RepID=A0A2M7S5E7_9BACT|nr:MAG: hypothetical protein AUJ67_03880 [Candidatus Desantisbacteria bacterium CG1_02_49_89]PIV57301.1 MAG: hypothetical protein COS16_01190 [Candidatus Desantisbacteria bacterium CG02_land_8_20_14_3_00_49_13]PIZ14679.1 MAG: hypothetical protein COY52_11515 [Candidatus Desantisbacteria bacterium CG_4_10_14_0_8_um_filter_48_22]PJB27227.1 MAG: hypothetical protein CO111_06425 [Candidatus Desantisbacteria bacterium CG_4_9_14_3_um_filter_50_7]